MATAEAWDHLRAWAIGEGEKRWAPWGSMEWEAVAVAVKGSGVIGSGPVSCDKQVVL